MKYLKWIVLAVFVLLLAAGLIVYFSINGIVERKVESQATQQLNLKTELSNAQVSLFGGNLKLNGLEIASPQGFAAPHLFTLGQADLSVKLGELRSDPVHVSSITLNKPKLVIEQAGTQLNFKKAMDLIPKGPAESTTQTQPLKVVINELTISEPSVVIRPGFPGLAQEITVPIPTIVMKNIGTGDGAQNGAAIKDVVQQVITALAAQAANSNALPEQLRQLLNLNVKEMIAGLAPELQKRIADVLPGDLGKAVGGLLNDPDALLKNPGQAIKENAAREGGKLLQGVLGGNADPASTTQPADPVRSGVEKGAGDAIKGLLGGDKKKEKNR